MSKSASSVEGRAAAASGGGGGRLPQLASAARYNAGPRHPKDHRFSQHNVGRFYRDGTMERFTKKQAEEQVREAARARRERGRGDDASARQRERLAKVEAKMAAEAARIAAMEARLAAREAARREAAAAAAGLSPRGLERGTFHGPFRCARGQTASPAPPRPEGAPEDRRLI